MNTLPPLKPPNSGPFPSGNAVIPESASGNRADWPPPQLASLLAESPTRWFPELTSASSEQVRIEPASGEAHQEIDERIDRILARLHG